MQLKKIKDLIKFYFRFSVFNYTFLGFVFLISSLFFITLINFNNLKNENIENAKDLARSTSENLHQYVDGIFHKGSHFINEAEVEILTNVLNNKKLTTLEMSKILYRSLPLNAEFELMGITDEEGYYIAKSDWALEKENLINTKKSNLSDRAYFQLLKNNNSKEFIISKPIKSKTTGHWIIVIAKRRFTLNGKFIGVALVTVLLEKISQVFAATNAMIDGTVAFFDSEFEIISSTPFEEKNLGKKIPHIQNLLPLIKNEAKVFITHDLLDRKEMVWGFSKIHENNLRILWGVPVDSVLKEAILEFRKIVFIEIIITMLGLIFLYFKYSTFCRLEMLQLNEVNNAKMAMLGEFAAGVAHEVNNPLSIIIGLASTLSNKKFELITEKEFQDKLKKIISTSERINTIVKSLKNLGHSPKSTELISYDLGVLLNDVLQIVQINLKANEISFKTALSENLKIKCIPSELSQVFLNLFSNSIYAIKNYPEKWIEIESEVMGDKVLIHFTDSGNGIPLEIRNKLMSSFYTTKPIGEGTGLGLSICRRIMKNQKGDLIIDGNHKNTRFTLELYLGKT
jgi:signal transduction histidine kinase